MNKLFNTILKQLSKQFYKRVNPNDPNMYNNTGNIYF